MPPRRARQLRAPVHRATARRAPGRIEVRERRRRALACRSHVVTPMPRPLRVWAPRAGRVDFEIDGRCATASSEGSGWWRGPTPASGARYAIRIDGGPPRPDPRSPWQPDGVHAASSRAAAGGSTRTGTTTFIMRSMRCSPASTAATTGTSPNPTHSRACSSTATRSTIEARRAHSELRDPSPAATRVTRQRGAIAIQRGALRLVCNLTDEPAPADLGGNVILASVALANHRELPPLGCALVRG